MKRIHKRKVQYSVIFFILVTIGIFFLASALKERTNDALAHNIQTALDLHQEGVYTVGETITMLNSISTIGSFYSVITNQNIEMQAGVIRIMGIAGPVSAVFLHENGNTQLIGTVGLIDMQHEGQDGITSSQILYWQNTVSEAFEDYFLKGGTQ